MNHQPPVPPFKVITAIIFFIVSFSFPPLLLVSVPLLATVLAAVYRRWRLVVASRDFYLEERDLMQQSRLFRSGR